LRKLLGGVFLECFPASQLGEKFNVYLSVFLLFAKQYDRKRKRSLTVSLVVVRVTAATDEP
jgi:hypothetical protein